LQTILHRCRDAGCEVGPVHARDWHVEAELFLGSNTVKALVYFNAKGALTPRVQGKASALRDLVESMLYAEELPSSPFLPPDVERWIGVDESGKGDYFGPLVAAAVMLTPDLLLQLRSLSLRDSKELQAERITTAARTIRNVCGDACTVVTVLPERYNEFMNGDSFGKNSQRILAWMHARCIENLLEKHETVRHAICDKFAKEHVIQQALLPRGRTITLHQHVRAEADPAVAAAAILARDEFVRRMRALEEEAGCTLPLGASDERGILTAAGHILQRHGKGALARFAKLHFRTTTRIMQHWGTDNLFAP
jgi:ribonuclease HIII